MIKKTAIISIFVLAFFGVFTSINAAPTCEDGVTELSNGICIPVDSGLPDPDPENGGVETVITSVMQWILSILAAIAIIGFVISGIQYLFSAGDDKTMQTAKRNMVYCIIGVVIGISGYIVISAIEAALNGSSAF
jgi:hypothetical protein